MHICKKRSIRYITVRFFSNINLNHYQSQKCIIVRLFRCSSYTLSIPASFQQCFSVVHLMSIRQMLPFYLHGPLSTSWCLHPSPVTCITIWLCFGLSEYTTVLNRSRLQLLILFCYHYVNGADDILLLMLESSPMWPDYISQANVSMRCRPIS